MTSQLAEYCDLGERFFEKSFSIFLENTAFNQIKTNLRLFVCGYIDNFHCKLLSRSFFYCSTNC